MHERPRAQLTGCELAKRPQRPRWILDVGVQNCAGCRRRDVHHELHGSRSLAMGDEGKPPAGRARRACPTQSRLFSGRARKPQQAHTTMWETLTHTLRVAVWFCGTSMQKSHHVHRASTHNATTLVLAMGSPSLVQVATKCFVFQLSLFSSGSPVVVTALCCAHSTRHERRRAASVARPASSCSAQGNAALLVLWSWSCSCTRAFWNVFTQKPFHGAQQRQQKASHPEQRLSQPLPGVATAPASCGCAVKHEAHRPQRPHPPFRSAGFFRRRLRKPTRTMTCSGCWHWALAIHWGSHSHM